MDKQKKTYLAPDIAVTQVEIESSICGGSVDIVNKQDPMGIEAQQTNTAFDAGSQTTGGDYNGWEYTQSGQ